MLLLLSLLACVENKEADIRKEGTVGGDCSDGADNDDDGAFDCEDDGCAGSPDCIEESDTGAVEDTDTDDTDTEDTDTTEDVDTEDTNDEDTATTQMVGGEMNPMAIGLPMMAEV